MITTYIYKTNTHVKHFSLNKQLKFRPAPMFFFFFILFRANARAAPLGPKQAADEVSGKSKILNGIELSYFSINDIENPLNSSYGMRENNFINRISSKFKNQQITKSISTSKEIKRTSNRHNNRKFDNDSEYTISNQKNQKLKNNFRENKSTIIQQTQTKKRFY